MAQAPVPKYWQLADDFRREIEGGVLSPGERLPSLAEMRDEYDASRPTVEKVYELLEREGLVQRKHGQGVFVAHRPTRAATGIVGLSGEGLSFNGNSSYWAQLMGGVHEAATQARLQLLILDAVSPMGWEKADGVLVCDWEGNRALRKRPIGQPIVSLLAPIEGVASVVADDYAGVRAATERLLELGHRKIGFLHSYKQILLERRLAGYRDALQTANIQPLPTWDRNLSGWLDYGQTFVIAGREAMGEWLQDGWRETGCTALLCHNDETAIGAMQALQSEGLKVPEDVSVVGFDGTELCDLAVPPLSSVEVPLREIGAAGVELLLQQISAAEIRNEHKVLSVELRERQSTTAPPRR